MSYEKIKQPKLADVIENRLETMILDGSLKLGEKLPAERELAKQFDVSRPSLREAMHRLESKGLLTRRHGEGTYIKEDLRKQLIDPFFELLNTQPESQYDLLEFRYALEGASAYYAALRGSTTDFNRIKNSFIAIEQARQVQDIEKEIQSVAAFYLAVIGASHNVVFIHLAQGIKPLLEKSIADNIKLLCTYPDVADKIHLHRLQLFEAILSKKPDDAQQASARHLSYIEETRTEMLREKSIFTRTLRRF